MTRTKLSERSGISLTSIKPFYDDTWRGIRRDTIEAFCKTLGVSAGELFEYVETNPKRKVK